MLLVGSVVVAVAVVAVGRPLVASWNTLRRVARSGADARTELCGPEALTPRQRELITQMGRLGFVAEPSGRVMLGSNDPSVVATARDGAGTMWFRASAIEGLDLTTASLTTLYPGGKVVTSSAASASVDPHEVVQCLPDAAPGRLLGMHRDAIDALARAGAEPTPLPVDLLAALRDEWVDESRTFADAGLLRQLSLARAVMAPRATAVVAERSDLHEVAARLASPASR